MTGAPVRFGWARTGVGELLVAATERGVCCASLQEREAALASLSSWRDRHEPDAELAEDPRAPHVARAVRELEEYGRGERRVFDVELDLRGTDFQLRCWEELVKIPFGVTRTYAEQARRVGNPNAFRAVGHANGKNPIPVIVPCHRVLSRGGLGGFTGGLHHKVRLLEHEGVLLSGAQLSF